MDDVILSGPSTAGQFLAAANGDPARAVFDADVYLPMMSEFDLTEDQSRELLTTLWEIMRGFVELGLSVDVCGQLGLDADPVLTNGTASVNSNDPTQTD